MTKKILGILPVALLCLSFNAALAQNKKIDILPSGTVIPITFTHHVCSNGNDQVRAFVSKDIYGDSGKIVIRGGESVAINMQKRRARGWGRPGSIEVTALSVTSVDGKEIILNGSDYVEGDKRSTQAILTAVGGFFLVPFFGALLGALVKGYDVCIEGIPVVRVTNTTEVLVK